MFEEFYEMYEPEEQEVVALINRCIGGGYNWKGKFWEMTVVTLGMVFCDTGKVSTKEEHLEWPVTDEERNSDKGWGRFQSEQTGGFVSQENYDNNLAVVNGHSYKDLKSDNTNLSILCSHNFSIPFNQPIAYAQKVGELTNMLANGQILVQRFGDILDGKRTWQKELAQSNIRPTLPDAVAGDITAAMPYRAMTNIINFIQAMDYVVPGFAAYETLLYSPELKFYSNRVKMDTDFNTSLQGLHCLGDSSGWTRGLMMASVMGTLMGRKIAEEG